MANTFTIERTVKFGGMHNQERLRFYGILAIDTTANGGAVAGDLPASMFGNLRLIENSSPAVADDNSKVYPTVPAYNGESLLVGDGASSAPQDLPNDNYRIMVEGLR